MQERWSQFKKHIWGTDYEIWHDGTDHVGLDYLIEKEGEHVKAMLFEGLAMKDPVAVRGLTFLPANEVRDVTKKALKQSSGLFKIELAGLLSNIDPENRGYYLEILHDRLERTTSDTDRGRIKDILAKIDD